MNSMHLSPATGFFSSSLVRWIKPVTTIPLKAMILGKFLLPAKHGFLQSVRSYVARILLFITGAGSRFYNIWGNTDA